MITPINPRSLEKLEQIRQTYKIAKFIKNDSDNSFKESLTTEELKVLQLAFKNLKEKDKRVYLDSERFQILKKVKTKEKFGNETTKKTTKNMIQIGQEFFNFLPIQKKLNELSEEFILKNQEIEKIEDSLDKELEGNSNKECIKNKILINITFKEERLDLSNLDLNVIPNCLLNIEHLKHLDLSKNNFSEFPESLTKLNNLEYLYLSNNKIKNIPKEIQNLKELKSLHLSENKLSEFPKLTNPLIKLEQINLSENQFKKFPEGLCNCTKLDWIDVSGNEFEEAIPKEIGNFTNLIGLDLSKNNLKDNYLISEIQNLKNLEFLFLNGNKELSTLPMFLSEIPELKNIEIKDTNINLDLRKTILNACKTTEKLKHELKLWNEISKDENKIAKVMHYILDSNDIKNIFMFTQEEKNNIIDWLKRLKSTKDFSSSQQKELAILVCKMLKTVVQNNDFKENFIIQVSANNESCDDRSAMALNEIFVSWKIATLSENSNLEEKLRLLKGVAKTLCLRKQISKRIEDYEKREKRIENENVEIYLYYEQTLKERLNLISATNEMSYTEIGKRDWIDEDKLTEDINENYFEELYTIPAFQSLCKEDKNLQETINKNLEIANLKLEQLGPPPLGDKFSEDVLDHKAKLGEIMNERKETDFLATKNWWEELKNK